MKQILVLSVVGLILGGSIGWAAPATFYVVHELEGTLSEYGRSQNYVVGGRSAAYAINNLGVVSGSAERNTGSGNFECATIWTDADLARSMDNGTSRAVDINDGWQVLKQFIGSSWHTSDTNAWYGQRFTTVPDTNTYARQTTDPNGSFAAPTAINALGQVATNGLHNEYEESSWVMSASIWDENWTRQATPYESCNGVNDFGTAIGTNWVDLWDDDTAIYLSLHGYVGETDLGHLWNPGVVEAGQPVVAATTSPRDISNLGLVVGNSTVAENQDHAFLWQSGTMIDLGTLGGEESQANAVNELGAVVGTAQIVSGDSHAFLYHSLLGMMVDLNVLVPEAASLGIYLESANDINENGEIVGVARRIGTGREVGFIMSPGAFLEGASSTASIDPEGFLTGGFSVAGLGPMTESLGTVVSLDSFVLLGSSATLSVPYEESMLAEMGLNENDLRIYWYDESGEEWILAGGLSNNTPGGEFVLGAPTGNLGDFGVDTEANLVWVNIDHASDYGVFALPEPASIAILSVGAIALIGRRKRYAS